MKSFAGITALSFPFAAGTAAAAVLNIPFAGALACSSASILLISFCIISPKRSGAALCALFFCLGALCWCSAALSPAPPIRPAGGPAMDALVRRIDALGLAGGHSPAILEALLTGRRSSLPRSTIEIFRKSGASHILALSGLHLGVIYGCIRKILLPAGNSRGAKAAAAVLTVSLCGGYVLATGASASITRAFLFIFINECSRLVSGRKSRPLGTFCLALMIQLCLRPDMISSAGFQLSYLAMLGITLLNPRLSAWYPDSGRPDPLRRIWKAAALSVSCQLFTAPAAWWHFRSFPLYFLITNLIALPLTECIIITALGALALDAVHLPAQVLALACGKMIQGLEFCLETIASL